MEQGIQDNGSIQILVAEDNQVSQLMIRSILKKMGHQVTLVASGKEVIEEVGKRDFDLILMDINMPGMNGIEAAREILTKKSDTKIYALSAHTTPDIVAQALAAGVTGYLSKPIKQLEVRKVVEEVLKKTHVD